MYSVLDVRADTIPKGENAGQRVMYPGASRGLPGCSPWFDSNIQLLLNPHINKLQRLKVPPTSSTWIVYPMSQRPHRKPTSTRG